MDDMYVANYNTYGVVTVNFKVQEDSHLTMDIH